MAGHDEGENLWLNSSWTCSCQSTAGRGRTDCPATSGTWVPSSRTGSRARAPRRRPPSWDGGRTSCSGLPEQFRDDGWQRLARLDKVVFLRSLTSADWPNTRMCGEDPAEEVRALKERSAVPLRTMGSLSLVRQLLAAGLVDRLRLMVFPLTAGPSGREAAFEGVASTDLELVGHQILDGRVLLVEYRPTGKDIPRV